MSWKEAALAHAKTSSKEVCGLVCLVDGAETYIACKYDWSDLREKIDYVLSNYIEIRN